MKTKFNIPVGRFRLTEAFAERMLGYYSRRVKRGEMPNQITSAALDGRFTESVEDKLRYMVGSIGKLDETDAPGERETHSAYCAAAEFFGLPQPATPKFEDEEQQQQPQGGGQGKPKQSKGKKQKQEKPDDGDAGEGSDDQSGEGKQSKPQKSDKGEGSAGESESESESEQSDSDGEGESEGESDGDGSGNDEGDAGEGESDSDGGGADSEGDSDEGDGDADEGQGGDSDGEGDGQSEEEGENEGTGGGSGRGSSGGDSHVQEAPHDLDLEGDVKGLMNYHEGPEPKLEPHPLAHITQHPNRERGGVNPTPYSFDFAGTNQLLARVREELMSVSRHRKYRDKDNGHVDTDTKLVDLATGNNIDRAFYTQTNARRLNTAVQIYVDISGSMSDSGLMPTACAVCFLLADTLEKLRVPVEVIAFDGDAYIVKQWHEKVQNTPIMSLRAHGGTKLPNAQASGMKSLMARRERRKVHFVLTDGDVGWPRGEQFRATAQQQRRTADNYASYARDFEQKGQREEAEAYRSYAANYETAAKHCEAQAVEHDKLGPIQRRLNCPNLECYGFGIGVDVPSGLFKKAVSNLTPKNMVEVIVDTLGHALHGVE